MDVPDVQSTTLAVYHEESLPSPSLTSTPQRQSYSLSPSSDADARISEIDEMGTEQVPAGVATALESDPIIAVTTPETPIPKSIASIPAEIDESITVKKEQEGAAAAAEAEAEIVVKNESLRLPTPPPSLSASSVSPEPAGTSAAVARVTSLETKLTDITTQAKTARKQFEDQGAAFTRLMDDQKILKTSYLEANELREKLLKQKKELDEQRKANFSDVRRLKEEKETKDTEITAQKSVKMGAARKAEKLEAERAELEDELKEAVYDRDLEAEFSDQGLRQVARQMGWRREDGEFDHADLTEQEAWVMVASRLAGGARDVDIEDFALIEEGLQRASAERSVDPTRRAHSVKDKDDVVSSGEHNESRSTAHKTADKKTSSDGSVVVSMEGMQDLFSEFRATGQNIMKAMGMLRGTKRKLPADTESNLEGDSEETSPTPADGKKKAKSSTSAGRGLKRLKRSTLSVGRSRSVRMRRPSRGEYFEGPDSGDEEEIDESHTRGTDADSDHGEEDDLKNGHVDEMDEGNGDVDDSEGEDNEDGSENEESEEESEFESET